MSAACLLLVLTWSSAGQASDDPSVAPNLKRSATREVHPGVRVMVVDPADVTPSNEYAPSRVQIATIAKVTARDGKQLTIRDEFGLGTVNVDDVIQLGANDVDDQIKRRIPKSHRMLAEAEFAALHSKSIAWERFVELVENNPEHRWFRTRQAKFYVDHERLAELAAAMVDLTHEGSSSALSRVLALSTESMYGRVDGFKSILASDPNNTPARVGLLKTYAEMVRVSIAAESANEYYRFVSKTSDELWDQVPGHPVAAGVELDISVSLARAGKNVNVAWFKTALQRAEAALKADPYDLKLMLSLADACGAAGDSNKAGVIAMRAVERFPRSSEAVSLVLNHAEARANDQAIDKFCNDYKVSEIANGLRAIEEIDLPQGENSMPPLRLVDGNGRRDNGYTVDEESQLSAMQILVLADNANCIRFLQDFDPTFAVSSKSSHDLFAAACQTDSYHALEVLLRSSEPLKQPSRWDPVFEMALSRKSDVCLCLLWGQGIRPSESVIEQLMERFACQNDDLGKAIGDAAIEKLASALPERFAPAINVRNTGINTERESRNLLARLEGIAQRQAIYGDSGGYQQTMNGVRELRQQLANSSDYEGTASILVVDCIHRELRTIKTLFDDERQKTWSRKLMSFAEAKHTWMVPDVKGALSITHMKYE